MEVGGYRDLQVGFEALARRQRRDGEVAVQGLAGLRRVPVQAQRGRTIGIRRPRIAGIDHADVHADIVARRQLGGAALQRLHGEIRQCRQRGHLQAVVQRRGLRQQPHIAVALGDDGVADGRQQGADRDHLARRRVESHRRLQVAATVVALQLHAGLVGGEAGNDVEQLAAALADADRIVRHAVVFRIGNAGQCANAQRAENHVDAIAVIGDHAWAFAIDQSSVRVLHRKGANQAGTAAAVAIAELQPLPRADEGIVDGGAGEGQRQPAVAGGGEVRLRHARIAGIDLLDGEPVHGAHGQIALVDVGEIDRVRRVTYPGHDWHGVLVGDRRCDVEAAALVYAPWTAPADAVEITQVNV